MVLAVEGASEPESGRATAETTVASNLSTDVTIPASIRARALGAAIVVASIVYLIPFVPRGWVPHDEGMLAQAADRVMRGGVPHVNYEEPYTGALTYVYAALFRATGVDLLHVRWLMFAVAAAAAWITYALLRRYLRPVAAGVATVVAVTWSFPNYFAGLPSWWLLLCALVQLAAMLRAADTEGTRHLVLVAVAALAAGVAITIKQTGAYLVVALGLWALYDGGVVPARRRSLEAAARWITGAVAIAFAAVMIGPRLGQAEGLYLFAPAAATAMVVWFPTRGSLPAFDVRSPIATAAFAGAIAAVPIAIFLAPYAAGHHLDRLVDGALVAPQRRLAFASMAMPSAWWMLAAAPFLGLVVLESTREKPASALYAGGLLALSVVIAISAMWSGAGYQLIWQGARAVAALVPIIICWQLVSGRVENPRCRSMLFATAAVLAWTSLNQYPFAAPIYFSYTTPLVVVAGIAAADAADAVRSRVMVPFATLLLLFAILIANRGDLHTLGSLYAPVDRDTDLDLPRAHLRVGAGEAAVYKQLLAAIATAYRGGQMIAGPDCPEVYFLAGLQSPSGTLFDFLSTGDPDDPAPWLKADVVVINHQPQFSPSPSDRLLAVLRNEFVHGEEMGRFEIRWR